MRLLTDGKNSVIISTRDIPIRVAVRPFPVHPKYRGGREKILFFLLEFLREEGIAHMDFVTSQELYWLGSWTLSVITLMVQIFILIISAKKK